MKAAREVFSSKICLGNRRIFKISPRSISEREGFYCDYTCDRNDKTSSLEL